MKLWDVRAGEWRRALLAFCMLMLVVGSYTIVKSVRDAVFLSRFSVTSLSFIAIGLAVVTSFIVSLYLRFTAGLSRTLLIGGTNIVVATSLALIWLGLGVDALTTLLPWVLYIWSSIFGVFLVMQFWLLAGDLFDTREAKRLFGLVGAGAILGGVSGGLFSRLLADSLGTRGLLLVAAGMLLIEALLARAIWPLRRSEESPPPRAKKDEKSTRGGFSTLIEHPYVGTLALALLLSTIATTLLDWQFKGIVKAAFVGRTNEMTAYFGTLYAYLSGISFLLQAFLTGFVLKRFGVRWGLLLLPLSVMAGSALILTHTLLPGVSRLFAASSAKVAEGGLRFAIDKASFELLWMPVPGRVKEQGKAFVDTVMDRLGTGVTGLVWLLLAAFGLSSPSRIHLMSIAVLALALIWVMVLLRVRHAYVDAFRGMLARREISLKGAGLMDAEARRTITRALESDDTQQLSFALYLLDRSWSGELPDLTPTFDCGDDTIVVQALELLRSQRDVKHREVAATCLASSSRQVRRAAIVYLRSTAAPDGDPLIEGLAQAAARETQLDPTTIQLIQLGIPRHAAEAKASLAEALRLLPAAKRISLVRQLGAAPGPVAAELLRSAIETPDATLAKAAISAAGESGASTLIPSVIGRLGQRECRPVAMDTLRRFGDEALAPLCAAATDAKADLAARAAAIRVLGASRDASLSRPLLDLALEAPELKGAVLRALVRLRSHVEFELNDAHLESLLEHELLDAYRALLYLGRGSWATLREVAAEGPLLHRALEEAADKNLQRIFHLLALRFDVDDIRAAHRGLRSPRRAIRASSLEFLDNLLPAETKGRLLPLVEDSPPPRLAEAAQRWPGLAAEHDEPLLRRLLVGRDLMLRALAAHCAGEDQIATLADALRAARDLSPPWVRSICKRALSQIGDPDPEELPMGLTPVEKALKLQAVDVLKRASTEDLVYVAQIAEELELDPGAEIYAEGDAPDALYVVVSGRVRLHRDGDEIALLEAEEAFGSWALVDEAPRVTSATTTERCTLLKVDREEFTELLADRVDIVQAIFKAMVDRLRALANVAQGI